MENGISQIAAALGISHNISTGDYGDNLALDQADFGIDSVSVNANPDSPFATGVGGTSTFLDSKNNIKLQTGWGLNESPHSGADSESANDSSAVFRLPGRVGRRYECCLCEAEVSKEFAREVPAGAGYLDECGPRDG